MTTMKESRSPQAGQQCTYILNPPLGIGCEVQWAINDENAALRSNIGGLKVVGFSGAGQMTVEVVGDVSKTTVTATIICPGKPKQVVGPMEVGSGTWPLAPAAAPGPAVAPPPPFPIINWPWWNRIIGQCPDFWNIGAAKCPCNQASVVTGFPPVYYHIECTFTCPLQVVTLTWTLSFGFVIDGPN